MSAEEQLVLEGAERKSPEETFRMRLVGVLAALAVLTSAFHLWPFESSRLGQALHVSNLCVLAGLAAIGLAAVGLAAARRAARDRLRASLPPVSIWTFLAVCTLSLAFSPKFGSGVQAAVKLLLAYAGGYVVFRFAAAGRRGLRLMCRASTIAITLAALACIVGRHAFGRYGFHGSFFKYGAYVGMLAPLCVVFLLAGRSGAWSVLGGLLAVLALLSAGSLGAVAGMAAGLLAALLAAPRQIRLPLAAGLGLVVLSAAGLWRYPSLGDLRSDTRLMEADGRNVRQRYIEWQAELDLIRCRPVAGTGLGGLNTYRGMHYGRFPKLNTLQPFDQNGWLMIGAESGLLALACFAWAVAQVAGNLLRGIRARPRSGRLQVRLALLAGLIGMSAANLFSSVHFNGNAGSAALILALGAAAGDVRRGRNDEEMAAR